MNAVLASPCRHDMVGCTCNFQLGPNLVFWDLGSWCRADRVVVPGIIQYAAHALVDLFIERHSSIRGLGGQSAWCVTLHQHPESDHGVGSLDMTVAFKPFCESFLQQQHPHCVALKLGLVGSAIAN